MKILYLIDTKKYGYHKKCADEFTAVTGGEVTDMNDFGSLYEAYSDVEKKAPDVIVTFDAAGFDLRTVTDTLSLNNIYAKMAHILFHDISFYKKDMYMRQNLSMFTFVPDGSDIEKIREKYDMIPNISCMGRYYYKAGSKEESMANEDTVNGWWDFFRKAAML